MIPPLSASDLNGNPSFARLWKFLVTEVVVDDDGARRNTEGYAHDAESGISGTIVAEEFETRDDGERQGDGKSKMTRAFQEQVDAARIRGMKTEMIRQLLIDLPYGSDGERDGLDHPARNPYVEEAEEEDRTTKTADPYNPHEGNLSNLRDLILIVSSHLDVNATSRVQLLTQENLLSDDIARFQSDTVLTRIAGALSHRLADLETSLCKLASFASEEGSDYIKNRQSPSLAVTVRTQLKQLAHLRTTLLPSALSTLTSTLHELLALQRDLLGAQIRRLEAAKHGVLSRHALARTAFLETVATAMSLKCQVLTLETQRAMDLDLALGGGERQQQSEKEHGKTNQQVLEELHAEDGRLDERIALLEDVCGEFDAADPRGGVLTSLAKRYGELEAEMERARGDIADLRRR